MKHHLVLVMLAGMLLIPGCTKKSGGKPDAALNLRLDAIRQAGYPVTLAELNDSYVEPPAMENAAPLYLDAFAALAPLEPTSAAFLTQNKEALGLLHQAGVRKRCRYPTDLTKGANALLPHLAKFKKSAQLLSQQATNCASKGQIDLAVQSLLDGLRLGRSLEEEPLVLSHVMQIAAENMMQAALESMLGRKGFSEEHLALLQAAFHQAESGMPLARSLAGERCMGVAAFQLPPDEQAQMLAKIQKPSIAFDFQGYRNSPDYSADLNFYLDLMDAGIAAATLPFPKSLEETSQWTSQATEARSKGWQISAMLLPALQPAFERTAECAARLRITQAALAVERYRLAHQNALPDSLGQVTPLFIPEVPADPFDGQALRYKTVPSAGYIVYSIGKDRVDDAGASKPPKTKNQVGSHLTFFVKR